MSYISTYTANDFAAGENVRYVPGHAHGNIEDKCCEDGVVSSTNSSVVFVRYVRSGILQETSQSTDPRDLIKIKS